MGTKTNNRRFKLGEDIIPTWFTDKVASGDVEVALERSSFVYRYYSVVVGKELLKCHGDIIYELDLYGYNQ